MAGDGRVGGGRPKPVGLPLSALLVLFLSLVVVVAGCAGGGGEYGGGGSGEEVAPPVTGNFVGEAPDEDAFVALVAASPEEEEGQERDVRAYLCDGESISEWFTGTAEGNELNLTSEGGGARLEGNLSTEASTGTITLEDDRTLTYAAELARGVAGLYNVTLSEEGGVRGTSETGGLLEGQLGEEDEMRGEEQVRPVSGTFISDEGEEVGFEVFGREADPGEYRWIVLEDGLAKGAKRGARTGSPSGYIDPVSDL